MANHEEDDAFGMAHRQQLHARYLAGYTEGWTACLTYLKGVTEDELATERGMRRPA